MESDTRPGARRIFLRLAAGAAVVVAFNGLLPGRQATAAGELPKLDPDDAQAKALDYTHHSSKDGQTCSNCQFFKGDDGAAWGKCQIFPGKRVSAAGWCKSWIKQGG